ncbi:proteinase-activated receptor 1-like [Tiliqua scincoides]|uniref:proteinase-activated receptor 1-like n=1 Tax=Tiliqua scincoides TaxID=71010 RepID=UPI0034625364
MWSSFVFWEEKTENQKGNYSETRKVIPNDTARYLTSRWLTRFVPSFQTLVVGFGLPLNIFAIFIFVVKIKPKNPAVVYMLNLALADVLLVSVLPFKISYRFSGNNWVLGPEMCRVVTTAFYCNMYCSILLMMAISIDRFLLVLYPMQSLLWRTPRRASVLCIAIWIIAVAGMIPLLTTEQTERMPQLNITTCHDVLDVFVVIGTYRYYTSALSVVFFFIPLIISTTCYVCIIRNLSSSNVVAKSDKKRRAILLSVAVLCSFIVSFGPTNVLLLVQSVCFSDHQHLESLHFAYMLAVGIGTINCCIDPLIYYYASSKCQRQVWKFLCCKKHREKGSETSGSQVTTFFSGLNHLSKA